MDSQRLAKFVKSESLSDYSHGISNAGSGSKSPLITDCQKLGQNVRENGRHYFFRM